MSSFFRLLLLVSAVLVGVALPAHAERRVALVIGNGAYKSQRILVNPTNDAVLISDALTKAGFQTIETKTNLGIADFRQALRRFQAQTNGAEMAFVYFAGHGVEANGSNWLIPTDAELAEDRDLDYEAIKTDLVLQALQGARMRVLVLDACRDNPFARSWRSGTRNTVSGLAKIEADDVLVLFAAAPGRTASDGLGNNSPFALALAQRLPQPGLAIQLLGGNVRDDVLTSTGGSQRPYVSASITGNPFYMVPAVTTASGALPAVATQSAAERDWQQYAKDTRDIALLEAFKRKHAGDPVHVRLADARVDALKRIEAEERKEAELARAGRVFRDCPTCPEMVVVPAGRFTMGASSSDAGRTELELPQHSVMIAKPFAIGKFLVTVEQFRAFVTEAGYDAGSQCFTWGLAKGQEQGIGRSWRDPGFAQSGSHPVVCMNWDDAKSYADWLAKKTGKSYRLVSESEWEFAARAGTTTRYSFGDREQDLCRFGNGADDTANRDPVLQAWLNQAKRAIAQCSDGFVYTAPVGSFAANAFGLFDMHGNALQWVEDCWHSNYQGAPSDGSAWIAGGDCRSRVLRGGSWIDDPRSLRSAVRSTNGNGRNNHFGFRVARNL